MTYEFDSLTFPSAEARAWFINADKAAQQEWRDKHTPMKAPVASEIVVPPHDPAAGWQASGAVAESTKEVQIGGRTPDLAPAADAEKPPAYSVGDRRRSEQQTASLADVVERLNDRAADLAGELLGQPNAVLSTKSGLRYGKKGSLALEIDGPKAGCWFDHEEGVGGGALDLICRERRMTMGEAIAWARRWLGLPHPDRNAASRT